MSGIQVVPEKVGFLGLWVLGVEETSEETCSGTEETYEETCSGTGVTEADLAPVPDSGSVIRSVAFWIIPGSLHAPLQISVTVEVQNHPLSGHGGSSYSCGAWVL